MKGMELSTQISRTCPVDVDRDERKSARIAAEHVVAEQGAKVIVSFNFAREVLRSSITMQRGAGAAAIDRRRPGSGSNANQRSVGARCS